MTEATAAGWLIGVTIGFGFAFLHLWLVWWSAAATIARKSLVPAALGYLVRLVLLGCAVLYAAYAHPARETLLAALLGFTAFRLAALCLVRNRGRAALETRS